MAHRLALFDFDGTLCRVNSYHVLVGDRLRSGLDAFLRIVPALVLRRLRLIPGSALKNTVLSGFRGWSRSRLGEYGRAFYERRLAPRLLPAALAELEQRRQQGFTLVVVSGAFEFLLAPFCAEHRIGLRGCTQVAFSGNTCLGRVAGEEMRGVVKRQFLRTQFDGQTVDWEASCAYSDEIEDLPLLNLVGHPFLVGEKSGPLSSELPFKIQRIAW